MFTDTAKENMKDYKCLQTQVKKIVNDKRS